MSELDLYYNKQVVIKHVLWFGAKKRLIKMVLLSTHSIYVLVEK